MAFVNSGLLRIARQDAGLSQGEAAERLGIPQVMLSRYENAIAIPSNNILERASNAYDVPTSFFEQTDTVLGAPVSVHPMWRKKQSITIKEMDAIIAEMNIRILQLRRMLNGVEFVPQATMPTFDAEEYGDNPERIASMVRGHWMIPRGPLQNLTEMVERAGAIVIHSPMDGSSVSGVTMAVPGLLPIILLNSEQPSDRARFTLAHELAHLVMHRFPNPSMEQQANTFASALLMPADDIRSAFMSGRIDLMRLAALKPEWKVSMQALLYRAQSLGFVTIKQAGYLWRQFNVHRIKLQEPPELNFPMETPGVLTRMIKLHLETFGYSIPEFAQMLHFYPHRLKSLYHLNDHYRPQQGVGLALA
ncbi:MAG: XRE family transcriptional regulator [Nitrospira sp.]|jgi:Zn-dependent peptidase ImmA (M78 family)/transcriptional regulator with XRE-family HTH domain|nr:XRE family transcriptional regulator [Nitrospira sp.]